MWKLHKRTLLLVFVGVIIFVLLAAIMVKLIPAGYGIDWVYVYHPAAAALLRGENPYEAAQFFAAPWGLIPLLPVAILPPEIGRVVIMLIAIIAFAYTAYRLGASPLTMSLFLLSPPVVHCILNANVEWIPLLGFVLPPPVGLFFISVKPQTGFAVAIFWFFESWRIGGWRKTLQTFAPVTIAVLLSHILFKSWPFGMGDVIGIGQDFNTSLWPLSIPIGLVLLATAIQKREIKFSMPASPFLSPYVLFHSWSSAIVALVTSPVQLFLTVVSLWVIVAIQALGG